MNNLRVLIENPHIDISSGGCHLTSPLEPIHQETFERISELHELFQGPFHR